MIKNFLKCSVYVGLLLSLSPNSWAQVEVSPDIHWKTLNTTHFEVIFNAEQQDLGALYAEKLEKAYHDLQPYFRSFPAKTIVVINDKTDVTNGYATPLPYSHIMAYPVLPGPEESLADTGDWVYELLSHEFTHVLTFAPHDGVMRPLRTVFGTIIAPNLLLPRWWKEGVAVEMETRLSHHGRLRSNFQDATIRAMVQAETFYGYDIAEANESLPSWPQGARPYVFGSLFWSEAVHDKGPQVVADLHESHGRRVPYAINDPAINYLGADYTMAYNKMLVTVNELAVAQIKKLSAVPPTPIVLPKNRFNSVSSPAISPNGQHMIIIVENDANSREIKILNREKEGQDFLEVKDLETIEDFNEAPSVTQSHDGPPSGSIQRVSWFPDSKSFVYDKIDYSSRYDTFSDLWTFDLSAKKPKRLSRSLRAREPVVSPQAGQVAFIQLEGGKTHLALFNLADKTSSRLFSAPIQERLSYPTYLNDNQLVFSWRKTNGEEFLYRISTNGGEPEKVLASFPNARFARLTSAGLIFTSTTNGVSNLYLADANLQTAKPLTHTLTASFSSDLDPQRKDLYITTMTAQGLRVGQVSSAQWSTTPAQLPVVPGLLADRYKAPSEDGTVKAKEEAAKAELGDYSSGQYLWPRYWIPFISGSTSETGVEITAQTSGFDPLKKHTYSLIGSFDTGIGRGSFQASYLNQQTRLPISLFGFKRSTYLGNVSNKVEDMGATLLALPDMFWLSPYASLAAGWKYAEREYGSTARRMGPTAYVSYANYSASGAQISPEKGWGGYLGADHFIEHDDYLQYSQFSVVGLRYFSSKYLPRHHAMMIRLAGLHIPEQVGFINGGSTESLNFFTDSIIPQYIMRGYVKGQFYGRNIANVNLEYRFPLYRFENGGGTTPLFLHNLVGAVVADGIAMDGGLINPEKGTAERISMQRSFWSAGAELKFETTLGYVFPLNVIVGVYGAFNQPEGAEMTAGTRLQFSGL